MGHTLARAVAVLGPDGIAHSFAEGDEAPAWLEEKVTNPAVWGDEPEEVEARSVPTDELESEPERESDTERRDREVRAVPTSELEDDVEDDAAEEVGPPPRAGSGSGRQAWVAYAEDNGVGVTDSMTRDDIIRALELAEIPTE